MPIVQMIDRAPDGLLVTALFMGMVINTFFLHLFKIGELTLLPSGYAGRRVQRCRPLMVETGASGAPAGRGPRTTSTGPADDPAERALK